MEEAVTGPWKEQLYGEAPRQDLFSEEETQSAHDNQPEESREWILSPHSPSTLWSSASASRKQRSWRGDSEPIDTVQLGQSPWALGVE